MGQVYEQWHSESGLLHFYSGGLEFDVGSPESAKYLERKQVTPWLDAEYISPETAEKDKLSWAPERYVRWLAAPSATFHFPFYPEDWPGDLSVCVELRPKNNPSMAVRFYKSDGIGGRVWSDPLTTDLTPGWHGYRWRLPREYLVKDGMQLMRVSFPGTYFEGENRVSAKFLRVGICDSEAPVGKYPIQVPARLHQIWSSRVLDQSMDAYGLNRGDRLERYLIVPESGILRFYAAPGAWLENPVKLVIQGVSESGYSLKLTPGDCWTLQEIDLSKLAHQAIRISMYSEEIPSDSAFSPKSSDYPDIYISEPEIIVPNKQDFEKARETFSHPKRIAVVAIDNLRADRIWVDSKRRATPVLSRIADEGLQGIMMGDGMGSIATTVSFLTSVPADVHKVYTSETHVREVLTSIAEAAGTQGWKSHFYSTSGVVDSTRGYAQGFDSIHQLNKENIYDARGALAAAASDIAASGEHSLYYIHLSELRLPYRASADKMELWGVPGYRGPVDMAAMQNTMVLKDPAPIDGAQLEAYYDGELAGIDSALGEFLARVPEDTLVVVFGTHGNSLGESTLGYEQGLTPWELLTPYVFYMSGHPVNIRRDGVSKASELSVSILDLIDADIPAESKTVFELHDSRPSAQKDGVSATASMDYFYRIRREGVDILFTTGLDGNLAHEVRNPASVILQAMREKLD